VGFPVTINAEHQSADGKMVHYKVKDAKMSYVVTMGQAFDSKRMESFDTMQTVLQSAPDLIHVIGDVFFRNSDLAGADQIAERLHKMLPPQLQDDAQNQLPPQAQAAVAQAQQQVQGMQAELQKLAMEKMGKIQEHQGKMQQIQLQAQADMQLEKLKLENQLAVAEINTKAQSALQRQQFIEDLWNQFHGNAHEAGLAAQQAAHGQVSTAQQAGHQRDLQAQQADAQSQQSAQDAAQSQQVNGADQGAVQ